MQINVISQGSYHNLSCITQTANIKIRPLYQLITYVEEVKSNGKF